MAIKRFLQFTTKSSHDLPAQGGTGASDDVSVINRPLRFGQRAWATFTAITGTTPATASAEHSAAPTKENESDARHLDIGGYFHADQTWAGSTHETAPLENVFDRGAGRVFDRFGPH